MGNDGDKIAEQFEKGIEGSTGEYYLGKIGSLPSEVVKVISNFFKKEVTPSAPTEKFETSRVQDACSGGDTEYDIPGL
ncbi:MAG: hypothetical protein KAJ29_04185 [Alphaproteobacteria bacterium]|nr:hypothetical protein [Alphaproteobacteria bacterium]